MIYSNFQTLQITLCITLLFLSLNTKAQILWSTSIKGGLKSSYSNTFVSNNPTPSSITFTDFYAIDINAHFGKSNNHKIISYFNFIEDSSLKYNYDPAYARSALVYKTNPVIIRSVGLGYSFTIKGKRNKIHFAPKIILGHHWPVSRGAEIIEEIITHKLDDNITIYKIEERIDQYYFNSYFIETGMDFIKPISKEINIIAQANFRQSLFQPIFQSSLSYNHELNGNTNDIIKTIGAIYPGNAIFISIGLNYLLNV